MTPIVGTITVTQTDLGVEIRADVKASDSESTPAWLIEIGLQAINREIAQALSIQPQVLRTEWEPRQ